MFFYGKSGNNGKKVFNYLNLQNENLWESHGKNKNLWEK